MAGKRKATGDPLRAQKRLAARLEWHGAAVAAAAGPVQEMTAAVRRLASVLELLPPERAGRLAGLVTDLAVTATGDATTDVQTLAAQTLAAEKKRAPK